MDKKKKQQENESPSQQLYSHLFEACNIMRGPINQDEYKSYITPLLFFKRISDSFDEETEIALKESDGDKEYAAFPENHIFQIPEGCHWIDVRNKSENIGKAIVNAMNGIERANQDKIAGLFSSFDDANWTDKNKLSDERLKNLIEHMSQVRLRNSDYPSDVMGDAYEYLIKKFADLSKKNAGEFYTPRTIVKLMIWLLDPQPGDSVYDPACGTGGMLIEAIKYIHNDKQTYGKIYGQEKNLSTSAIASMNLLLHGKRDVTVTQGDTLRKPNYIEGGKLKTFNCVVANPPFSLKNWGAAQFETDPYGRNLWGCPTDKNGDFAWLQHMVKSMDPVRGKCAVVLPQGVLFRGNRDGKIREELVKTDLLDCIIGLTGGVFYSTTVSACILYLNNRKPKEHKGKVCMIDASSIYTAQRAQNIMSEEDIDRVFKLYADYKDVPDFVKIVSNKDIVANGNSLAINNYVKKTSEEVASPEEVRKKFFEALKDVQDAEAKMMKLLEDGGYLSE
ncbi:MAG: N-6 DNA methylase [Lacrimispora saccharolytica]|uniref:type I restriction-modification system subunit M n=1 Tax=Sellimonas sp. TaxID=2021466 RepID=UPI00257B0681|nr:class I SAM-dependent DNA methyltransferase [Sellimonas sp.]